VLLFKPMNLDPSSWKRVRDAIRAGRLHASLKSVDPFSAMPVEDDTRKTRGFKDPKIFISFCTDDAHVVGRLMEALHYRRRRYYALYDPFRGTGGEPGTNSVAAVKKAGAVIIVFSDAYVKRYQEQPNGNIAKELQEIGRRRDDEGLAVATLSVCPYGTIKNLIPYNLLGYNETPNIGEALADAPDALIERAIDAALQEIDAQIPMKK